MDKNKKAVWGWAIFVYIMGIIGFSGANIFYDSLLPDVADENKIDYISGGILFFFVDEEKGRIEAATHLNPIS